MTDQRKVTGTVKTESDSGSAEAIAYQLLRDIARAEPKELKSDPRKYLLDLYAECLNAARGYRQFD